MYILWLQKCIRCSCWICSRFSSHVFPALPFSRQRTSESSKPEFASVTIVDDRLSQSDIMKPQTQRLSIDVKISCHILKNINYMCTHFRSFLEILDHNNFGRCWTMDGDSLWSHESFVPELRNRPRCTQPAVFSSPSLCHLWKTGFRLHFLYRINWCTSIICRFDSVIRAIMWIDWCYPPFLRRHTSPGQAQNEPPAGRHTPLEPRVKKGSCVLRKPWAVLQKANVILKLSEPLKVGLCMYLVPSMVYKAELHVSRRQHKFHRTHPRQGIAERTKKTL